VSSLLCRDKRLLESHYVIYPLEDYEVNNYVPAILEATRKAYLRAFANPNGASIVPAQALNEAIDPSNQQLVDSYSSILSGSIKDGGSCLVAERRRRPSQCLFGLQLLGVVRVSPVIESPESPLTRFVRNVLPRQKQREGPKSLEIVDLAVTKPRRGIGSRLVWEALKDEDPASSIYADALPGSEDFYKYLGMRAIGDNLLSPGELQPFVAGNYEIMPIRHQADPVAIVKDKLSQRYGGDQES
jgi:hypothetical protein